MNIELSDEEMAKASGGSNSNQSTNKFNVGDKVVVWADTLGEIVEVFGYYDNVWVYRVMIDNNPDEVYYVAEIMLKPR